MSRLQIAVLGLAIAGLSACATFKPKLDASRAKAVKKVAIISFEIQQQQPTDNLGIAKFKELKQGRPGESAELKKMADDVYAFTTQGLAKRTGWRVLSLNEVKSNAAYAAKWTEKMTGFRSATMGDGHSEAVLAEGILDQSNFRRLSHDQRAQLAKALGVDAFAEIIVFQTIEQSRFSLGHLSGDAEFALRARSNLMVYGVENDDPIWRIQNIDGPETAKSGTLPEDMPKLRRLAALGGDAARTSLNKLFDAYKLD